MAQKRFTTGGSAAHGGFPRTKFSELDDTFPYAGKAGDVVIVNGTETGLSAVALPVIDDHKVLESGTDSTAGYLSDKLEAGTAINITEDISVPANHKAKIDVSLGTSGTQAAAGNDPRFGNYDSDFKSYVIVNT